MSYLVIARKWRPQRFEDIIGQEYIIKVLQNAIKLDRVSHAYVFTGPRGVGKTTTARVLSKALNCSEGPTSTPCLKCLSCQEIYKGISLDVLEIDGASNRGIDQVRELRGNVKFKPVHSRYKIYIIDEVHMLTEQAFNALLKTLEEPPEHVKFIFATTQPNKIPATILSRCQKFDFRPLPAAIIKDKIVQILKDEKIEFSQTAVSLIAEAAQGSLRDAESLLDQFICISRDSGIDIEAVYRFLGAIEVDVLCKFIEALTNCSEKESLILLDALISEGKEISQIVENLIQNIRSLLLIKVLHPQEITASFVSVNVKELEKYAQQLCKEEIIFMLDILADIQDKMRYSFSPRLLLELGFIKMCDRSRYQVLSELEYNKAYNKDEKINPKVGSSNMLKLGVKADISIAGENLAAEVSVPKKETINEVKVENKDSHVDLTYEVKNVWPQVLKILEQKKMILASCLSEAEISSFKNNVLILEVNSESNFHSEFLEEKENRTLLEECIYEVLKARAEVVYKKTKVSAAGESKFQEILKNPKLKKISAMFNAKVLKITPENEI